MKAVSLVTTLALSLSLSFGFALWAASRQEPSRDRLERCWQDVARAPAGTDPLPECFLGLVRELSPRVLGATWPLVSERDQHRFEEAFSESLHRRMATVANVGATFVLDADERPRDVLWNGTSLVDRYREECERMLRRYSFAYLLGELEGKGIVVLEDFEEGPLDAVPRGWESRPFGGKPGPLPYRVVEENGNRFLRAEDRGENVMLYKEVRWDSRKYPYLSFRFRIRAVPAGSDERIEDKADSAAGLYLSYGRKLGVIPETVKFVWSGVVSAGTAFRRPGIGMPWTVVAGSGPADESTWHRFVFDTRRVYEQTFGGSGDERPLGIGILTDANSTGGLAAADYDDIVALASSATEDRIRRIENVPAN